MYSIKVSKTEPRDTNLAWIKPLADGYAFYLYLNGAWIPIKLVDDNDTDSTSDDKITDVVNSFKRGVVNNATIEDNKLIISYNEESGKQPVEIPIVAEIDIDSTLDATSENPVQNKVIKAALDTKLSSSQMATINGSRIDQGGNVTIVAAEGQTITIDAAPTAGSSNAVSSGGVHSVTSLNRYLQDALVLDFRPGYITGSTGNPYNIIADDTKHYCIVPANPGLSQVILKGCTSYQRWNIDASGNVISSGQARAAVPSNAKFLIFNFEDADNTYSGVTILQNLSAVEQERFNSHDYNCFVRYSTNQDMEYTTSNGILYSQFYRSIIDIKLDGFNKDNPHHLYNLTRDYGSTHKYGIIIRELINGTWTIVFNSSKTNVETDGVQNGVNIVTWTSGTKSVTATIDYSLLTANVDVNLAVVPYVFKEECFESIDSLTTQVSTIQANALFKQMLGMSVVSNNIANPANIQDGKFISDTGSMASDSTWSLVSVPVESGKKYTFGGFYLGRSGYYRFEDTNGDKLSNGSYSDPNGTQTPCTVAAPTGAVALLFDIKTSSSPINPYANLMANEGETLLPYDEYKEAITSIDNEPVAGGVSKDIKNRVDALEDAVVQIQAEVDSGLQTLIADLPVSDGTDVSVGYAYIETGTNVVKVKMS